jgi:hypothetical protein
MTGGARVSAERERGASVPFRERHRVGRGPDPGLGQIRSRGLLLFFVLFLFPFSIFLFSLNQNPIFFKIQRSILE